MTLNQQVFVFDFDIVITDKQSGHTTYIDILGTLNYYQKIDKDFSMLNYKAKGKADWMRHLGFHYVTIGKKEWNAQGASPQDILRKKLSFLW